MFFHVFNKGVAQLVNARSGFGAASDAAEAIQNEIDTHSLDHVGNPLEVSFASATKVDVINAAVINGKGDFLGANTFFRHVVLCIGVSSHGANRRHLKFFVVHAINPFFVLRSDRSGRYYETRIFLAKLVFIFLLGILIQRGIAQERCTSASRANRYPQELPPQHPAEEKEELSF